MEYNFDINYVIFIESVNCPTFLSSVIPIYIEIVHINSIHYLNILQMMRVGILFTSGKRLHDRITSLGEEV
jgi:Na+-transporting NADH:ubiquinone oxidoreductase subunit NqrA